MQVKVLKRLFGRLRDSYSAAGADEPAKDMRRLSDLLRGNEDKTVEEFVAETRALLDPGQLQATDGIAQVSDEAIAKHVRNLLGAGTDRSAFDAAMAELEQDREVGKMELFAIANRYRNQPSGGTHEIRYKSLKQARGSMRDVFRERTDSQSKRDAIERLTKRAC
jgi:hypothetical protein